MKRFTLVVALVVVAACSAGVAGCSHHAPSDQPKDQGAPAYVFLASPVTGSYITGLVLPVIGGVVGAMTSQKE